MSILVLRLSGGETSLSPMTIALSPAPRAPLSARIAAALSLHPILRRAAAQALHAAMLRLPDSIGTAANWRALSSVLLECEIELYPRPHMVPPVAGDIGRALEFSALARDAHNRGVMMRMRCERDALRSGRRVPRVIEAECRVVA